MCLTPRLWDSPRTTRATCKREDVQTEHPKPLPQPHPRTRAFSQNPAQSPLRPLILHCPTPPHAQKGLCGFFGVLSYWIFDMIETNSAPRSRICRSEPFALPKPHSERAMRLTWCLPPSDVDRRLRLLQTDLLDPGAAISHQQKDT